MMRKFLGLGALISGIVLSTTASIVTAEDYVIDTKGAHAFVQFRIKHLGYSWLYGRFNKFSGEFSYDASAPEKSAVVVELETASLDSNHAERDKHLRSDDFLNVDKFPKARFESTRVESTGSGKANIHGKLTLHGVTKDVVLAAEDTGAGKDPWGGYRQGFFGTTTIALKDFGIDYNLGPASTHVELILSIEGIRK